MASGSSAPGAAAPPHHPFGFSQVPGDPSFRNMAVNAVALIPLLSSSGGGDGNPQETHSERSCRDLWDALSRHSTARQHNPSDTNTTKDELLLVVANASLTRPGDWRYQETPLKSFHWQYGCQRLRLFDGRPDATRWAQDRLLNPTQTRDWIDACPHRRTAAVVGILNVHDCASQADVQRAQEELHSWATQRYATPPYQVTAHGQMGIERDQPVERLFVFDSFDEECQHIDLSSSKDDNGAGGASILAFPPSDEAHSQMMDLHLNVVVNDLCVAVFQSLEAKIRQSDELAKHDVSTAMSNNSTHSVSNSSRHNPRGPLSRYISGGSAVEGGGNEEEPQRRAAPDLSLKSMAGLVSPDNKLAQDAAGGGLMSDSSVHSKSAHGTLSSHGSPPRGTATAASLATAAQPKPSTAANLRRLSNNNANVTPPHLLTPLDDYYEWSTSQLSVKDTDALKRRDMARREKMAADLSLLAGSPLDAYERYLKAAHWSKTHPDPLWYALALIGCAAAHISMAEAGGYNVDEYLENNFSLPEDILATAAAHDSSIPLHAGNNKQTFPEVIFALCEEALAILNRHALLAPFQAGLLFQLARYTAESAEAHLRCRWGEGTGSFAGEGPQARWEAAPSIPPHILRTTDGRDMIDINMLNRTKTICELLQQAVAVADLDAATRLDLATQSAQLCLQGIPNTKWKKTPGQDEFISLPRKAAYMATVAAEAMSILNGSASGGSNNPTLENLWLLACQLYSSRPNGSVGASNELGCYAWATLRACTLHGLSVQGASPTCLEASERLLTLLQAIRPPAKKKAKKATISTTPQKTPIKTASSTGSARPGTVEASSSQGSEDSAPSGSEYQSGDETYTASVTKMIRESFTQVTGASSLLTVQAKWASESAKKAVRVPLAAEHLVLPSQSQHRSSSPNKALLALPCVWSTIDYNASSTAQRECAERVAQLKKGLAKSSHAVEPALSLSLQQDVPLSVSRTTWSLQPFEPYELELIKRKVVTEDKGAMATFFNPYEKSGQQREVVAVAAEEERVVTLYVTNALSVPLRVKECLLDFGSATGSRINTAPVSFVLPAQADEYPVQFPFTLLSPEHLASDATSDELESGEFEVQGLSFTCLNHTYSLTLTAGGSNKRIADLPEPASYPYTKRATENKDESGGAAPTTPFGPKIEALPCQPRLYLRYAQTGNAFHSKVQLGVTQGEIVSTPTFELTNDLGPKGHGRLERLQVSVVGLGASEKTIYDSGNATLQEESHKADFQPEALPAEGSSSNPAVLKVRTLPGTALDLKALNSPVAGADANQDAAVAARTLGFQIAVGFGKLQTAEITFRIRYAGKFTKTREVWRRFDLPMTLSNFAGPRVTALTLRPDLTEHALHPELLQQLEARRRAAKASSEAPPLPSTESKLSHRVGLDRSVQVMSDKFVAICTILNDSNQDILLSRASSEPVATFASTPLPTLVVPRGVKVSIPMTIGRLKRGSSDDKQPSFAEELIQATSLQWKTVEKKSGSTDSSNPHLFAQGSMSLKPEQVSGLIAKTPSFIPSMFEPPCSIQLKVQGQDATQGYTCSASAGDSIELAVDVTVADWVAADILRAGCEATVEFFAVWLDAPATTAAAARDRVWCGRVRKRLLQVDDKEEDDEAVQRTGQHEAKVILLQRGRYALSACVRFSQDSHNTNGDEVWWAPAASVVTVNPIKQ